MSNSKRACVVYVAATEGELPRIRNELETKNYSVCAVLAPDEIANNSRLEDLPVAVRDCIAQADICIFLLPEDAKNDSGIPGGAAMAVELGRRIVVLVAGDRAQYPENFDVASAIIRMASPRLSAVIDGEDTWEALDKTVIRERPIHHQKCQ